MNDPEAKVALLHTNREYATSLANAVYELNANIDVDVISRIPVYERIFRLLSQKYDLIQADELLVNGVLGAATGAMRRVPLVVCVRGWADYTNAHSQYGAFYDATIRLRTKITLRRAAALMFISQITQQEFSASYPVSSSEVIGRTIDIENYRGSDGNNRETFDILTVSNFRYEEKVDGVKTILRGLGGILSRYDNIRFRIAGGGQCLYHLREFLQSYPHNDQVELLGFVSDIDSELERADLFVYVSYLDSLGTVVLEAQAAGLPVIGGDAVGVPEAVGDAGIVCPPSPDGIADAVERVLADEDYRRELARLSQEKMASYNRECALRHVEVWNSVLD